MQSLRFIPLIAVVTFSIPTSAHADSSPLSARDVRSRFTWAAPMVRDSARVAATLAAAKRYAAAGRLSAARRQYMEAAEQQRADGDSPVATLWIVANGYFGEGNILAAARTLDETAAAAAEFGDPEMELRATFEAAVLYAQSGMPDRAVARVTRVQKLLKSPVVPHEQKAGIRRRLVIR